MKFIHRLLNKSLLYDILFSSLIYFVTYFLLRFSFPSTDIGVCTIFSCLVVIYFSILNEMVSIREMLKSYVDRDDKKG